jgi:hypothetical protein
MTSLETKREWFLDKPIEEYSWTKTGIYDDGKGHKYILPNNKEFIEWVNTTFKKYESVGPETSSCDQKEDKKDVTPPMFPHQAFAVDYMSLEKPFRGILAMFGLGSGKTRTAIESSNPYVTNGVKVVIVTPASLRPTWVNEIKKWGNQEVRLPSNYETLSSSEKSEIDDKIDRLIKKKYEFISYNASNTVDQFKRMISKTKNVLKHCFFIVDEVHNFVSLMVNPTGKKGQWIYKMLMNAIDCKFMFLSGTPLLNRPYELGILFNILKGKMKHNGVEHTLFPEKDADFDKYFVKDDMDVMNTNMFKRRILGMVSYYYGAKDDVYPKLVEQPIRKISFGETQFAKYKIVRDEEIEKELKSIRNRKMTNLTNRNDGDGKNQKAKQEIASTFRVFSRQYSNFGFPNGIKRPMPKDYMDLAVKKLHVDPNEWSDKEKDELSNIFDDDGEKVMNFVMEYSDLKTDSERHAYLMEVIKNSGKDVNEFSGIISVEDQFIFQEMESISRSYSDAIDTSIKLLEMKKDTYFRDQLSELSPKMAQMFDDLTNGPGSNGLSFVYSQFRTLEGVTLFSKVLDVNGYEPLSHHLITSDNIAEFIGKKRYVMYSGEEGQDERNHILWIYNHPLNKYGAICKVFLGTAAAAEGISTKNVKQVLIMEPYWNEVRIEQVIGRARRICSHNLLPPEERLVNVFRYHTVLTKEQQEKMGESQSTDEYMYNIAQRKKQINQKFLQTLKDCAVDCRINAARNISATNPIKCFTFTKGETGISFYPNLSDEKLDVTTQREHKKISISFKDIIVNGVTYVVKMDDSKKQLIEKISMVKHGIIDSTILYDKEMAQSGNMFVAKKAIVKIDGKMKMLSLDKGEFEIVDK